MLCPKATFYELGEKNTKYFFNLEKSRGKNKTMTSIKNSLGNLIQDPREILKEQRNFYSNLYKSNPNIQYTPRKLAKSLSEMEKTVIRNRTDHRGIR